jgi:hypothetical protein
VAGLCKQAATGVLLRRRLQQAASKERRIAVQVGRQGGAVSPGRVARHLAE